MPTLLASETFWTHSLVCARVWLREAPHIADQWGLRDRQRATLRHLARVLENTRNAAGDRGSALGVLEYATYPTIGYARSHVAQFCHSHDRAALCISAGSEALLMYALEALRARPPEAHVLEVGPITALEPRRVEEARTRRVRNMCQTASGGSYFARMTLTAAPADAPGVRILDARTFARGAYDDPLMRAAIVEGMLEEARDLALTHTTLTVDEALVHPVDFKRDAWRVVARAVVRCATLGWDAPVG